jgi:hypothetical protein
MMPRTEAEFRRLIDEVAIDYHIAADARPAPFTGVMPDVMLQQRQELAALAAFIVKNDIKTYLEIGFWTGRLCRFLREYTTIETVFGADLLHATHDGHRLHVPPGSVVFVGDSTSPEFVRWRTSIGHVDFVMIDGDHSYEGCRADWEIANEQSCDFVGFHDTSPHYDHTDGVTRVWREIVQDTSPDRIHDLARPFDERNMDISVCGIGVVDVRP